MRLHALLLATLLPACGPGSTSSPAPETIDHIVDPAARAVWPGVERPDGGRLVPLVAAYYAGRPVSYWFGGPASRLTADVFWFCRRGDTKCPLDAAGALKADRAVGGPVFARMPGEVGYSPYWLIWRVLVDESYRPDAVTSVFELRAAAAAGEVEIEALRFDHGGSTGPDNAVMNCLLVLPGTELEGNGSGARRIPLRRGWHKGYQVDFYDFTVTEGVIPADPSSESRPQMPAADLYVLERDCAGGSRSPLCTAGRESALIDERLMGVDFTGDGDLNDTNNVLAGIPGAARGESGGRYTALWRVMTVRVSAEADAKVPLADTPGAVPAITRYEDVAALIDEGLAAPPVPLRPGAVGLRPRAGDAEVLFNGAVQVTD